MGRRPEHRARDERRAGRPPRSDRRAQARVAASTGTCSCRPVPEGRAVVDPRDDSLGWLAAVGGGLGEPAWGPAYGGSAASRSTPSARVPQVAVVPTLRSGASPVAQELDRAVACPADRAQAAEIATDDDARAGRASRAAPTSRAHALLEVLDAVVHAVVRQAASCSSCRHHRRRSAHAADVAESVMNRLDGSTSSPRTAGRRGVRAHRSVAKPGGRPDPQPARRAARPARSRRCMVPVGARAGAEPFARRRRGRADRHPYRSAARQRARSPRAAPSRAATRRAPAARPGVPEHRPRRGR